MAVWTLKMNFADKPNSFQLCISNGIIGIGWGLTDESKKPSTISEYRELRTAPMTRQLSTVLNQMEKMNIGDYVWTVDTSSAIHTYYLCKLDSSYEYFDKDIQETCGIANGFRCSYHAVTSEELIPFNAIRYLNAKGLIFEIDKDNEITATKSIATAVSSIAEGK